jgi:hypothetical protein
VKSSSTLAIPQPYIQRVIYSEFARDQSVDEGDSWTDLLPGGFSTLKLLDPSRMLAISDSGSFYSSSDSGINWQFIGGNLTPTAAATASAPVPAPVSSSGIVTFSPADTMDNSLRAPRLISPEDGAIFSTFPRQITVRWQPSADAASYIVEWDYSYNGVWHIDDKKMPDFGLPVRGTEYSFDFVGAQPGRRRIFPVNAKGERGLPSEWRTFRFTK